MRALAACALAFGVAGYEGYASHPALGVVAGNLALAFALGACACVRARALGRS